MSLARSNPFFVEIMNEITGGNQLVGSIPTEVGELTSMLDLQLGKLAWIGFDMVGSSVDTLVLPIDLNFALPPPSRQFL